MQEKWKYIGDREGDFPEAYILNMDGHKFKVELNRSKKQVKIFVDTNDGEILESSITNGVVLEEINCRSGHKENLIDEFTSLGKYLSAIPDSKVIRLIGGNYGVFSDFITRSSNHINEDIRILKRLYRFFLGLPGLLIVTLIYWLKDLADRPRISDVVDAAIVVSGSYLVYLYNFNYILGGLALFLGSLATGYLDWLVRKREPYVLKIILISIPALYFMNLGLQYQ